MGIRFYREMLNDKRRVTAFREALLETVRPGETIVEVGSGVGTYGFFALQAGARKVYGIDYDAVTEVAKAISKVNGFEDRTVFIKDVSGKVKLPERADLLVTEDFNPLVLGPYLESLVIDPRERFLKPAGRVMPISLEAGTVAYLALSLAPAVPGTQIGPVDLHVDISAANLLGVLAVSVSGSGSDGYATIHAPIDNGELGVQGMDFYGQWFVLEDNGIMPAPNRLTSWPKLLRGPSGRIGARAAPRGLSASAGIHWTGF